MTSANETLIKEIEKRRKLFEHSLFGFVIFAAIMSFLSQPFLKYINPFNLFVVGFFLAVTTLYLYMSLVLTSWKYISILAYLLGAITGLTSTMTISDGWQTFKKSEGICSSIQLEMVSEKQDYDKKATLFSALGCRYKHNPESLLKYK